MIKSCLSLKKQLIFSTVEKIIVHILKAQTDFSIILPAIPQHIKVTQNMNQHRNTHFE